VATTTKESLTRTADIYKAYHAVLSSVRAFAGARMIVEILPCPTASEFEFSPERTYFIGDPQDPDLVLPASNTLQKQVACGLLGSIFCVAPCFRREPPDRSPQTTLHVFHQIEVELSGADAATARALALSLLRYVAADFPSAGRCQKQLSHIGVIDLLRQTGAPPSFETYDQWLARHYDPTSAAWVMHLPQNPHLAINRPVAGTNLAEAFELLLPDGYGEILSGGARDPDTAGRLWQGAGQDPSLGPKPSSGFGIGLERLVAWLMGCRDLTEIRLPHFGA
jgi:asparaginyl-tRNA synthetase